MNNFARLSASADAKFLLRWRGREEGPYPASAIEAKLAGNEIGLLHEILYDGRWMTLRDYMQEREAFLRAEHEAREEQERRTRDEAERQAREREEIYRLELLAEERRRAAELESIQSKLFGAGQPPILPMPPKRRGASFLEVAGGFILVAGLATAGFFFLAFDPSVQTAAGRVNNLGLLADRQNGIVAGLGIAVLGAIMAAAGFLARK